MLVESTAIAVPSRTINAIGSGLINIRELLCEIDKEIDMTSGRRVKVGETTQCWGRHGGGVLGGGRRRGR